MANWLYTTQRWQRLRRMRLQQNPLCELCMKQSRLTVAVQAITSLPSLRAAMRTHYD